jgi:hypothetical protein
MGWGYEKISRGVGGSLLIIPDLRWKTASRLGFGMTRSVGIKPSRKLYQICIA